MKPNTILTALSLALGAIAPPAGAQEVLPFTAPLTFTANDCLDIGSDLGSPVSLNYFDAAPFKFNGTINETKVKYTK